MNVKVDFVLACRVHLSLSLLAELSVPLLCFVLTTTLSVSAVKSRFERRLTTHATFTVVLDNHDGQGHPTTYLV
jgi:hypothetical protein